MSLEFVLTWLCACLGGLAGFLALRLSDEKRYAAEDKAEIARLRHVIAYAFSRINGGTDAGAD